MNRYTTLLSSLLIGLLSWGAGAAYAQSPELDECLGGTLYYVAFPDTTTNVQDARFPDNEPETFMLMIYSPVDQNVKIGRPNGASISVALTGGKVEEFDTKDVSVPLVTSINEPVANRVLKVESSSPVVLYAYLSSTFGTAGYTPLPVEAWGTEYYAAMWPPDKVRNIYPAGEDNFDASERVAAPAEILILASQDNTKVTISPTGGLAACQNCQTVTLQRGEAYQVQSFVDLDDVENQEDIAGSYIFATKPIGVVSGNTRSSVDLIATPMLAGNSPKDLMAEWLTPTYLHGTSFAFTPTLDEVRQRPNVDEFRRSESVRLLPSETGTNFTVSDTTGLGRPPTSAGPRVDPGQFVDLHLTDLTYGRLYQSDEPSQAFHAINSVAAFNGTTGSGNRIGASYRAWGSAMVEMVPRERWGSFAPFRVPSIPSGTRDYLMVITDTLHRTDIFLSQRNGPRIMVPFSHEIPGTDLVWTYLDVNSGVTYTLFGENNARFTGHLYGVEVGYEIWRPGSALEEKGSGSASAAPAEYEENVSAAYAMPLASLHCVGEESRRYKLDTIENDCGSLLLWVTDVEGRDLNLEYYGLDSDVTGNTNLELVLPDAEDLDTATAMLVRIGPSNPARSARAILEFRDRSRRGVGQQTGYEYEPFGPDPEELRFLKATAEVEKSIRLVNRLTEPVDLYEIFLVDTTGPFTIIGTTPTTPWSDSSQSVTLNPGESIEVTVRFTPELERRFVSVMRVNASCYNFAVPIVGESAAGEPCLFMSDLDFGTLGPDTSRSLPLEICNNGSGSVSFTSGPGGEAARWFLQEFSLRPADIARLQNNLVLGPGDCITLEVTFTSGDTTGNFRTVARFYADTRECRDTSVWTARVSLSSVGEQSGASALQITSLAPNPGDGLITVRYRGPVGKEEEVRLIDARGLERSVPIQREGSGVERSLTIDATALPSGLYYVRIQSGEGDVVRPVTIVR